MKNQREIYEALLAGETLKDVHGRIIKFNNEGEIVNIGRCAGYHFNQPWEWQIYKEPKWYDNIPKNGILCWYENSMRVAFNGWKEEDFKKAEPLAKKQIQVFMDNAPKD